MQFYLTREYLFTLLAQDYEPHIGVILSVLIFPLFVIFVINHGILIKLKQNASPS